MVQLQTVLHELEKCELSGWRYASYLIGIGTDGAASIISALWTFLQSIMMCVHCIARRLNLNLSPARDSQSIDLRSGMNQMCIFRILHQKSYKKQQKFYAIKF
jgi:hypothetical protein